MLAKYTARYHRLRELALFTLAALASSPALAVDGVIEINQARALAGGVTPGDAPGFPVTLSEDGSYRLTSNLDVSGETSPENVTVIEIQNDVRHVSIDLNGFSLLGSNTCVWNPSETPPVTCTNNDASGVGIAGSIAGTRVTNGKIIGMGGKGVDLGDGSLVDRVSTEQNGSHGVSLQGFSTVSGCISRLNRGNGISAFIGGVLAKENVAERNGGAGIAFTFAADATVAHNVVNTNRTGISVDGGYALVTGNTIRGNLGFGLRNSALGVVAYTKNVITDAARQGERSEGA